MRFALGVMRRVLWVWAIGGLVFAAQPSRAEEALRWKFKAGDAFDYELIQEMNMNIEAGQAGQLGTTAGQTMNMTWNVKSVDDKGSAVVEQKIDRIRMKMTAPGNQGFDYDTDSKDPAVGIAAMVAPTMEAMTAGQFTFTISPRGEVSDVKISDALLTAIKNGPGGESGAVEQFKSMVSQVALVLPENPPKTGETWTTKIAVNSPGGGSQSVETTYTYDGTRDADGTTYAVIKPSLKMDIAKNPMMEMKMKDQKTDGEVLFDVNAGRLHSISINQNITLDMIAGGQSMPGTIDQNIEVKVAPAKNKPADTKPAASPQPKPETATK
jgi:Family of unknown function (DUF6263)